LTPLVGRPHRQSRRYLSGVVANVLGVVHALGESAQRSSGAATDSTRRAALSTTFEPALLKRDDQEVGEYPLLSTLNI